MAENNKIRIEIIADTQKAANQLREFGEKMSNLGTRISAAFTLPIAGAFALAVKNSKELQDALKPLQDRFTGIAVQLGNALVPIVRQLTPLLMQLAQIATDLISKFTALDPQTQNIILGFVGFAAALGPVLFTIGQLASTIGTIQFLLAPLTAGVTGLGLAFAGTAASVLLLVGALYLFKQIWDSKEFKQVKAMLAGLGGFAASGGMIGYLATGGEKQIGAAQSAFYNSAKADNLLPGASNAPQSITVNINSLVSAADKNEALRNLLPFINEALRQNGLK